MDFLKTPLSAFDVVYQYGHVTNTGKEDFPHIKNPGLFSQKPQPSSPSTPPTQKIEEYPGSCFYREIIEDAQKTEILLYYGC